MFAVGKRIDHRDAGVAGESFDRGVLEDAGGDHLHPTAQISRHIGDTFAATHVNIIRRKVRTVAAKLRHAGLEGHAGAERRFLEDEGQGFAAQRPLGLVASVPLGLEARRPCEQRLSLVRGQICR